MSKLPVELECPGDIVFNKIVYVISPVFYSIGITPNGITTLSLVFGISSSYMVYQQDFFGGSITYIVAYTFDCLDGYNARKYKQTSKFGDYYDHFSDIFKFYLMIYSLYLVDSTILLWFTPPLIIGAWLMSSFLGCQEVYYNKRDESTFLGGLIFSSQMTQPDSIQYLKWFRHFGPGNYTLFMIFILACYHNHYHYDLEYECPLPGGVMTHSLRSWSPAKFCRPYGCLGWTGYKGGSIMQPRNEWQNREMSDKR